MSRLLMTSSMKSEPGRPLVRLGLPSAGDATDGVDTSAWASAVEGRRAAGARAVSLPPGRIAALPAAGVTAAAPATATPARNFRRSTLLLELFFMAAFLPLCRRRSAPPRRA